MGKQKFLSGESSDYKQMTDLNKETKPTNKEKNKANADKVCINLYRHNNIYV